MKRFGTIALSTSLLLMGCGSDDKKTVKIDQDSYAVQLVAADYGSSQVAVGNLSGDRTAVHGLMTKGKSDYTISTYEDTLYHIGKSQIDTIERFDTAQSLQRSEWQRISILDGEEQSANTYQLLQDATDNAYLIRYGATSIAQVDPTAVDQDSFVKRSIDLSAYTVEGNDTPKMVEAVLDGQTLYVVMQRLDSNWQPQQAYVAIIDVSDSENPIEVDTQPSEEGLKGIGLNVTNPFHIGVHNGYVYVAGRGNYGSDTGGVDRIDTMDYTVTSLISSETFSDFNSVSNDDNNSNDQYFHTTDLVVIDDTQAYVLANIEMGYTTLETKLVRFNPSNLDGYTVVEDEGVVGKNISFIEHGPNGYLWIGISNADKPALSLLDVDSDLLEDTVNLDMPPKKLQFLDFQESNSQL